MITARVTWPEWFAAMNSFRNYDRIHNHVRTSVGGRESSGKLKLLDYLAHLFVKSGDHNL
jgi:hypothetical protein